MRQGGRVDEASNRRGCAGTVCNERRRAWRAKRASAVWIARHHCFTDRVVCGRADRVIALSHRTDGCCRRCRGCVCRPRWGVLGIENAQHGVGGRLALRCLVYHGQWWLARMLVCQNGGGAQRARCRARVDVHAHRCQLDLGLKVHVCRGRPRKTRAANAVRQVAACRALLARDSGRIWVLGLSWALCLDRLDSRT